jgi:hypothetical protein
VLVERVDDAVADGLGVDGDHVAVAGPVVDAVLDDRFCDQGGDGLLAPGAACGDRACLRVSGKGIVVEAGYSRSYSLRPSSASRVRAAASSRRYPSISLWS